MAAEVGTLGLRIDATGVERGAQRAGRAVAGLNQQVTTASRAMTNALRSVAAILAAIGGGQVVRGIINTADAFKRLEFQLRAVSKTAAATAQGMDFVKGLARTVPFSLKTISDAFVKLTAVGLKPMQGSLMALIDASAAMGRTDEEFKRIVVAIQQMAGKGTVSMEELRQQLGEQLPVALKIMAREMELTIGQLVKQVSLGAVSAKVGLGALFKGLQRDFGGQAAKAMSLFSGRWNQLKTAVTELQLAVADLGLYEHVVDSTAALAASVNKLTAEVVAWRDTVADLLEDMETWVAKNEALAITLLAMAVTFLAVTAGAIAATVALKAFGMVLGIVVALLTGPAGLAALAVGAFVAWEENLFGIRDLLLTLWEVIKEGFTLAWDVVVITAENAWIKIKSVFTSTDSTALFDGIPKRWDEALERMRASMTRAGKTPIGEFAQKAAAELQEMLEKVGPAKGPGAGGGIMGALGLESMGTLDSITDTIMDKVRRVFGFIRKSGRETAATLRRDSRAGEDDDVLGGHDFTSTGGGGGLMGMAGNVGSAMKQIGMGLAAKAGKGGGILSAGLQGGAEGGPMGAVVGVLIQFIATSKVFARFVDQLDIIVEVMQAALEPLTPILDQIAIILLGIGKLFTAIVRPFLEIVAKVLGPVLKAITDVLKSVLSLFGVTISDSDITAITDLADNPTVELQLDTSAAMDQLTRVMGAIQAATTDEQRAAARQAFLSARAAAIAAQRAEGGGQTPAEQIASGTPNAQFTLFQKMFEAVEAFGRAIGDLVESLAQGVADFVTGLPQAVMDAIMAIIELDKALLKAVVGFGEALLTALFDGLMAIIAFDVFLKTAVVNFAIGMIEAIAGFVGTLGAELLKVFDITQYFPSTDKIMAALFDPTVVLRELGKLFSIDNLLPSPEDVKAGLVKAFGVSISPPMGGTGTIEGILGINMPWMKFATGGVVPGNPAAGDSVPSLLTPGERILTQAQQNAFLPPVPGLPLPSPGGGWDPIGEAEKAWDRIKDSLDLYEAALKWFREAAGGLMRGVMDGTGFFGLRDALGLEKGSNMVRGGGYNLHRGEAVLPSQFNPSSPAFDPAAFWAPAVAALQGGPGGGGGDIYVVAITDEGRREVRFESPDQAEAFSRDILVPGLQRGIRNGSISKGTLTGGGVA